MERSGVAPGADGAFERFLTAAIATIITIMFSWRLLEEEQQREAGGGGPRTNRALLAKAHMLENNSPASVVTSTSEKHDQNTNTSSNVDIEPSIKVEYARRCNTLPNQTIADDISKPNGDVSTQDDEDGDDDSGWASYSWEDDMYSEIHTRRSVKDFISSKSPNGHVVMSDDSGAGPMSPDMMERMYVNREYREIVGNPDYETMNISDSSSDSDEEDLYQPIVDSDEELGPPGLAPIIEEDSDIDDSSESEDEDENTNDKIHNEVDSNLRLSDIDDQIISSHVESEEQTPAKSAFSLFTPEAVEELGKDLERLESKIEDFEDKMMEEDVVSELDDVLDDFDDGEEDDIRQPSPIRTCAIDDDDNLSDESCSTCSSNFSVSTVISVNTEEKSTSKTEDESREIQNKTPVNVDVEDRGVNNDLITFIHSIDNPAIENGDEIADDRAKLDELTCNPIDSLSNNEVLAEKDPQYIVIDTDSIDAGNFNISDKEIQNVEQANSCDLTYDRANQEIQSSAEFREQVIEDDSEIKEQVESFTFEEKSAPLNSMYENCSENANDDEKMFDDDVQPREYNPYEDGYCDLMDYEDDSDDDDSFFMVYGNEGRLRKLDTFDNLDSIGTNRDLLIVEEANEDCDEIHKLSPSLVGEDPIIFSHTEEITTETHYRYYVQDRDTVNSNDTSVEDIKLYIEECASNSREELDKQESISPVSQNEIRKMNPHSVDVNDFNGNTNTCIEVSEQCECDSNDSGADQSIEIMNFRNLSALETCETGHIDDPERRSQEISKEEPYTSVATVEEHSDSEKVNGIRENLHTEDVRDEDLDLEVALVNNAYSSPVTCESDNLINECQFNDKRTSTLDFNLDTDHLAATKVELSHTTNSDISEYKEGVLSVDEHIKQDHTENLHTENNNEVDIQKTDMEADSPSHTLQISENSAPCENENSESSAKKQEVSNDNESQKCTTKELEKDEVFSNTEAEESTIEELEKSVLPCIERLSSVTEDQDSLETNENKDSETKSVNYENYERNLDIWNKYLDPASGKIDRSPAKTPSTFGVKSKIAKVPRRKTLPSQYTSVLQQPIVQEAPRIMVQSSPVKPLPVSRQKIFASRQKFLSAENLATSQTQDRFAQHRASFKNAKIPRNNRYQKRDHATTRVRSRNSSLDRLNHISSYYSSRYSSDDSFEKPELDALHEDCIFSPHRHEKILDTTQSIDNLAPSSDSLRRDLENLHLKSALTRYGSVASLETDIDTGETTETLYVFTDTDIESDLDLQKELSRAVSMSELNSKPRRSTGRGRFADRNVPKSKSLQTLETDIDDAFSAQGEGNLARVPSVHELRVTKSLSKLNVPDWFKNSSISRSGSTFSLYSSQRRDSTSTTSSFGYPPSLTASPCPSVTPGGTPVVIKTRVTPLSAKLLRTPKLPMTPEKSPLPQSSISLPSDKFRKKEKPKELMPIPIVPFSKLRLMFETKMDSKRVASSKTNQENSSSLKSPVHSPTSPIPTPVVAQVSHSEPPQATKVPQSILKKRDSQTSNKKSPTSEFPTVVTKLEKTHIENIETITNGEVNGDDNYTEERLSPTNQPSVSSKPARPDISKKPASEAPTKQSEQKTKAKNTKTSNEKPPVQPKPNALKLLMSKKSSSSSQNRKVPVPHMRTQTHSLVCSLSEIPRDVGAYDKPKGRRQYSSVPEQIRRTFIAAYKWQMSKNGTWKKDLEGLFDTRESTWLAP
ncbi:hypothetical protein FSP39_003878 [Pinctada imbricata]|uniref:Uncharacterized protein n=1 Tax=Pinctada imbricata TaxID=66713 RepID=A0AA88XKZ1_PINIB|nr:hypothetical protein FSP39_003878 [Pinctada imbricata]